MDAGEGDAARARAGVLLVVMVDSFRYGEAKGTRFVPALGINIRRGLVRRSVRGEKTRGRGQAGEDLS